MKRRRQIAILAFICSCTLTFAGESNETNSVEIIWDKTLPDGTAFLLEKQQRVYVRDEKNTSREGLPTNAIVFYGKHVSNSFRLIRKKRQTEDMVWEGGNSYGEAFFPAEGIGVVHTNLDQEVVLRWRRIDSKYLATRFDVETLGECVYILFASLGVYQLQERGSNDLGQWVTKSTSSVGGGITGKLKRVGDKLEIAVTDDKQHTVRYEISVSADKQITLKRVDSE